MSDTYIAEQEVLLSHAFPNELNRPQEQIQVVGVAVEIERERLVVEYHWFVVKAVQEILFLEFDLFAAFKVTNRALRRVVGHFVRRRIVAIRSVIGRFTIWRARVCQETY